METVPKLTFSKEMSWSGSGHWAWGSPLHASCYLPRGRLSAKLAPVHEHGVRRAPLHPTAAHAAPPAPSTSNYTQVFNRHSPRSSPAGRRYEMPEALNTYMWDTGTPHQGETCSGGQDALPCCGEGARAGRIRKGGQQSAGKEGEEISCTLQRRTPVFL